MKKLSLCLGILLASSVFAEPVKLLDYYQSESNKEIVTKPLLSFSEINKQSYSNMLDLLANRYYKKEMPIVEISSSIHYDFLDALDFERSYFLQSDIDFLAKYEDGFANSYLSNDLSFLSNIYQLYLIRVNAIINWSLDRLNQPFDLNTDRMIYDPGDENVSDQPAWAKDFAELQQRQNDRLTNQIIRLMIGGKTEQQARDTLILRYKSALLQRSEFDAQDLFDIYANVVTHRFDPHTDYYSPKSADDFNSTMSLKLQGIGLRLVIRNEIATVFSVISGGPADKDGRLKPKDKIIGVAQGEDGEMVDVVHRSLDKIIQLIRGKKGTIVRLLVEPANGGPNFELSLKRDKIELEDQRATAELETITNEDGNTYKIGVIKLPSFYLDVNGQKNGDKDYRSTTKDVRRLVDSLDQQGAQGMIIDLRSNGGGSLIEAVDMAGLFVKKGPVVRISSSSGRVVDREITPGKKIYQKPLAVLIDTWSASASEIFAAAMQDYHRALIIGSNSFGKGTVQRVVNLGLGKKNLGEIKYTVAMFYRINGGSTQLKGVQPDIAIPTSFELKRFGEEAKKYAFPWSKIDSAKYQTTDYISDDLKQYLQQKQSFRLENLPYLQSFVDYVGKFKDRLDRNKFPLNLELRKKNYQEWKDYEKTYQKIELQAIPELKSDIKLKKKVSERNDLAEAGTDLEVFVPDVVLFQGLQIFGDYLDLYYQPANQ